MQEQKLVLIASGEPREGAISIAQDVDVFLSHVRSGQALQYAAMTDRGLWLQMIKGSGRVDGVEVAAGDGIAMTNAARFQFVATEDSDFLLFDLG
jgi:redox-sensitive bicupin YhaK (pirin superfamily)